ncbi:hypothetical protein PZ938_03175 [Luteipulveratus sp. YIM 133132]|uniref:Uncharacterized protein n=1 Tax=Luteipulveratus flavus TaxID=3031728 RepID=A0ABT6CA11_9MICO|nr:MULTISPECIES: hypothetical protein [unclassified Luteipulveratus]MDE9364595.1 hypothetical protein [Luteipulveratus sp. YIM 133132]MDF8265744.1 hypothetical protein [Luteipulveratus sp. YIM 133296]
MADVVGVALEDGVALLVDGLLVDVLGPEDDAPPVGPSSLPHPASTPIVSTAPAAMTTPPRIEPSSFVRPTDV